MKNLSKRTKIILGIVGIVVVVAVIGLVSTQPPANELFGAAVLTITPANPTINVGSTLKLVTSANLTCSWETSNPTIVSFTSNETYLKEIQIKGIATGTATIKANCGPSGGYQPSTTVKVMGLNPANPSVDVGKTITLNVINAGTAPNCTWTSLSTANAQLSNATANSVVVKGYKTGSADISAKCSTGTLTTHVTMTNPASPTPEAILMSSIVYFSPTTQTLKVGASVTMKLSGFEGTNWSACTDRSDLVTISNKVLTTDTLTFMVTGKAVGQAKIKGCPADPNQPVDLMVIQTPTCTINPDYGTVYCSSVMTTYLEPSDATITVQ